jgi:hypothetical protein
MQHKDRLFSEQGMLHKPFTEKRLFMVEMRRVHKRELLLKPRVIKHRNGSVSVINPTYFAKRRILVSGVYGTYSWAGTGTFNRKTALKAEATRNATEAEKVRRIAANLPMKNDPIPDRAASPDLVRYRALMARKAIGAELSKEERAFMAAFREAARKDARAAVGMAREANPKWEPVIDKPATAPAPAPKVSAKSGRKLVRPEDKKPKKAKPTGIQGTVTAGALRHCNPGAIKGRR